MQKSEIISTIDELNQYLEGNVSEEAVVAALTELLAAARSSQNFDWDSGVDHEEPMKKYRIDQY